MSAKLREEFTAQGCLAIEEGLDESGEIFCTEGPHRRGQMEACVAGEGANHHIRSGSGRSRIRRENGGRPHVPPRTLKLLNSPGRRILRIGELR